MRGRVAACVLLAGLGMFALPGAAKKPAKTETSVSIDNEGSTVSIGVIVIGAHVKPKAGTISVTLVDTATRHVVGTWKAGRFSSLAGGPTLAFHVTFGGFTGASGGSGGTATTCTLKVDPALSDTTWAGPASVSVAPKDYVDSFIGARAAFAGQPGFAKSRSALSAI